MLQQEGAVVIDCIAPFSNRFAPSTLGTHQMILTRAKPCKCLHSDLVKSNNVSSGTHHRNLILGNFVAVNGDAQPGPQVVFN